VDKITVGRGARGPVTKALQRAFFDVIECRVPDEFSWLTFVQEVGTAKAATRRKTRAG
jgi:branched-chain amino acid aminotransferase